MLGSERRKLFPIVVVVQLLNYIKGLKEFCITLDIRLATNYSKKNWCTEASCDNSYQKSILALQNVNPTKRLMAIRHCHIMSCTCTLIG